MTAQLSNAINNYYTPQMDDVTAKFLRDMIAHHQAAVDMSRKYLDAEQHNRATSQQVIRLASGIISGQTGEIQQMTTWLTQAGQAVTGGDPMGGM
jgi:uncharacterized protein (DUF305 family)